MTKVASFTFLAITLSLLLACSAQAEVRPSSVYTQEKYTLIDDLADCAQLQSWFDATMDAHDGLQPGNQLRGEALDFSKYIDARMRDLGCYK